MAPLLQATELTVRIGRAEIVKRADLTVDRGSVVALVGPNGAGKSTVSRVVAGLQAASGGQVAWDGTPVSGRSGHKLARLRAFVPQHAPVPRGMTVAEAVDIG
ncbi:MAG: ABC transporter ATP-binding protein, partial [Solirubrobacteraceae bacterium]|nr:ABC transporter ATP-binding protein [Solirubrobacteraceae bacterium]